MQDRFDALRTAFGTSNLEEPTELAPAALERRHVADLVAWHARRDPAGAAVVAGAKVLRFGELVARASRLSAALLRAGVQRGDRVAIASERTPAMVAGLLATLNTGAAYVPLDPLTPVERARFMLQDSGARCLLADAGTAEHLAAFAPPTLLLEDPEWDRAGAPRQEVPVPMLDGDLAYCIYTSGTTGTPKAVAVSHGALAHLVAWHGKAFSVTPTDRALQFANLAFDAATWEIWGALCNGASLRLAPPETPSLAELTRLLAEHEITIAFLPTPMAELLIDSGEPLPASLRVLLTGGDRLRRSQHHLGATLVNNYGPTECCVVATSGAVDQSLQGARSPSIGSPIDRIGASLLDDRLRPVADGQEGQLFLRGAGLARGYLGRPALTAACFLPDPCGPPGSRMYATGDLCRRLPGGALDYIGRGDCQVKLRGYRIELGEVEAALLGCQGISHAAVALCDDGARLAAFLVVRQGAAVDPAALASDLSLRLPEYMIPTQWVTLDRLPLSPNGKIDRQALQASQVAFTEEPGRATSLHAAAPGMQPRSMPATELECTVCDVWATVLGVPHVALDVSFHALGGSSIQAIRAVAQLSAALGGRLAVPRLAAPDTAADHVRRIEMGDLAATWPRLPRVEGIALPGVRLPMARAQEQVCFLEQLDGGWRAYRSHALWRLRGVFDPLAFEGAIDDLLARHDVLRSAFVAEGGLWHREQQAMPPARLSMLDLSLLPDQQREAALAQHIACELGHRFSLSQPPIVRWWAARLGPEEHVILQSEHHNVHDGQSFRLMVRDLAEFYSARVERRALSLPPVEASYGRFCAEERAWLDSHSFREQLRDWTERLQGIASAGKVLENHIRPVERRFAGNQLRRQVDAGLVRRLREVARSMGSTLFSVSLAAFGLVCGRLSGKERVLLGTAVANRPGPEYASTVGMFVNAVAVPLDVSGLRPFRSRALEATEAVDFALARSAVPMNEIVRALGLSRSLAGEAPFNVCLSFHDSLPLHPRLSGLDVQVQEGLANGSAKFDLNVVGILDNETQEGAMEFLFEHDADRLPGALVEHLAACVVETLHAVAQDPTACIEPARVTVPAMSAQALAPDVVPANDESHLPALMSLLADLMPGTVLQPDQDVFAAGFHSLLMMQFVARCRERFGKEIRLRDVYRHATPRRIARAVAAASTADSRNLQT